VRIPEKTVDQSEGKAVPVLAMKTTGVEVQLYSFLTVILEEHECKLHSLTALFPGKNPGTH
jgi:uncharacterized protein YbbC (DUF1343 family)